MICSLEQLGRDTAIAAVPLLAVSAAYAKDASAYLATDLGPEERAGFSHVTPARRMPWLAGRAAAKAAVTSVLGEVTTRPQILADEVGRPFSTSPGAVVSLAHGGRWAIGAARPQGRVGVDIERLRPLAATTVRALFDPEEIEAVSASPFGGRHAGIALWSIREAVIKAFGGRFTSAWETVRLRAIDHGTVDVDIAADRQLSVHLQLHQRNVDDHLVTVISTDTKECSPWNPAPPSPRSPSSDTGASFPLTPTT